MEPVYRRRGFLPANDPLRTFPAGSPWPRLDQLGRDLPSMLLDARFRDFARSLKIPAWQAPEGETSPLSPEALASLRLYVVRLGFLASGYVNQVGQPPANLLPSNIAVPLVDACRRLQRPPILSYDGYALYNWKRFDLAGPIALGNIDTLQNFVHLYDEHWFILVHVEIEALAADILAAMDDARAAFDARDESGVNRLAGEDGRTACGDRSRSCGEFPSGWIRRCISKPSVLTSGSSSTSCTKESMSRSSTIAARRAPRAASCLRWSPF